MSDPAPEAPAGMSRTALNEPYRGLVEAFSIPAEVHRREGVAYASFGGVVPIHCCTPEQVKELSKKTHHYCDIFTEQLLEPLGELAYVRLDENTAEKVFINRTKRMLITSSDGTLAQWREAATFESANSYLAGTPIVNQKGGLVSVVTARRGNHYAVSSFEGEGGYFNTPLPWKVVDPPEGASVYGERWFTDLNDLKQYIDTLPYAEVSESVPPTPVLVRGASPRVALVAQNGRQFAHLYLHGVITDGVDYL